MKVIKTFSICTINSTIRPKICEVLDSEDGSTFTWPGAQLLAAYLAAHPAEIHQRVILEVGAGTGLPSIVSCLCGGKHVFATDREGEHEIYDLLNITIAMNNLQTRCSALPLPWGLTMEQLLPLFDQTIDVIIGADVFYNPENFDKIISTIACFMEINPYAAFLTTYQERRYC
jgi:predicted nicotinamide N-methyase